MAFRSIFFFVTVFFVSVFLIGCGSKTIQVEPVVKYGNPNQGHVKDIPRVKYRDDLGEITQKDIFDFSSDEYEKLGDAFFLNKKYDLAVSQYEKSLSKSPDNIRVKYKRAVGLLGLNLLKDAREQLEQIIEQDKNYALAYEGLGRVYLKEKQYVVSKNYFEKATQLDPLLWRAYGYLGNITHLQNAYKDAIHYYVTATTINPDAGYIYNNLGFSYYSISDWENAIKAYYRAIELNYTGPKVFNNLGKALVKTEAYDKAFKAYLKGGAEAVAYNNLGVGYLENGKISDATACFKKAIELSPQYYRVANDNLKKCRILQEQANNKEKNDDS